MKIQRVLRHTLLNILKIADKIFVAGLKRLPIFLQASIKENLEPRGQFNFCGTNIVLSSNSKLELKRLFPCREEPGTCAWIQAHIAPGDVFYDIGANVGSYSFIARVASDIALQDGFNGVGVNFFSRNTAKIFAFEPNPFTFASLSKNILINGCERDITAFAIALSDKTQIASFRYSTLRSGAASHALVDEEGETPLMFQRIPCMRLDDAVECFSIPLPSLMKIDVDGAELSVLCGAQQTLAHRGLRSILIEIDENKDPRMEVLALLRTYGFYMTQKQVVHSRRPTSKIFNCIVERRK